MVFVFGSNEAGRHGAGAARDARIRYGAILGQGFGLMQGDTGGSSFAIPTKDWVLQPLPLATIQFYVNRFIAFAKEFESLEFQVTQIGCGLAGFKSEDIAPMFINAPDNCHFDLAWEKFLGKGKKYWETF